MSTERWHPEWEPIVVAQDRVISGSLPAERQQSAYENVLKYIDDNLEQTHTVILKYLSERPDVPGLRAAERIIRYLANHPALDNNTRLTIADAFNCEVSYYGLDASKYKDRRIAPIVPLLVTVELSVDDCVEVG